MTDELTYTITMSFYSAQASSGHWILYREMHPSRFSYGIALNTPSFSLKWFLMSNISHVERFFILYRAGKCELYSKLIVIFLSI